MAEIRQSTVTLDDFARATTPEDPVEFTTLHPWVTPFVSGVEMKIPVSGFLGGTAVPTTPNRCVWEGDPYPMSQSAGQMPEVWARCQPSYAFPGGTRMALDDLDGFGYEVLENGGFNIIVRRYTGGGGFTDISGDVDSGSILPGTDNDRFTQDDCLQLLRLTSTHVELWRTTDSSDDTSWEQILTVPDTTYRDNMYGVLGCTGLEDGWSEFGGGVLNNWPQEFIRRPWRYEGRAIDRQLL